MTDLLRQENKNRGGFRIFIAAILVIGSAFSFSFYGRQLLLAVNFQNLLFFLAGLTLFLISSFFAVLLIGKTIWSSLIFFLAAGAALSVFYGELSANLTAACLAMWLFLLWGQNRIRAELNNSLKVQFFRLAKIFFSKVVFGTAVFLAFSVYLTAAAKDFPVSFRYFQLLLRPGEKTLAFSFTPDFNLQKPLQTVLAQLTEKQLAKTVPNFDKLPPLAKDVLIKESIQKGFLETMEKFSGYKIDLNEPTDKTIFEILRTKFGQLTDKTQTAVTIGIFAFFFLLLKTFLLPFRWLAALIGFFVYLLLLAFGSINVGLEASSKEVLT